MNDSIIYALDFDGVICDSAIETALSGWKAASQIWDDMPSQAEPALIEGFRQVRPIIETGYEAILTMRLLHLGSSIESIYATHKKAFAKLMQEAQVDSEALKSLFGATRDNWIADNQNEWVAKNPLFPGIAEKLRRLSQQGVWYVVTTKQERFVKEIFNANAIELAEENIFGLDRNMSKIEVLKLLLQRHPQQTLHFVEDRLPTLVNVAAQPELKAVELLFALWGYNTEEDKCLAETHGFQAQTVTEFLT